MEKFTIEAGTLVKFVYGACHGEAFGMVVESKTTVWGTNYKVLMNDGEFQWTSDIKPPGTRSGNGSPIGCFFASDED
jgi:hypothetical protein